MNFILRLMYFSPQYDIEVSSSNPPPTFNQTRKKNRNLIEKITVLSIYNLGFELVHGIHEYVLI